MKSLDRMIISSDFFVMYIVHDRQAWLSAIMWQIYFQSNLNLFSAGSSVQTLIQGIII